MKKILVFFFFVILQGIGIAHGSFISMETKTSATFHENRLIVEVDVTNKGDEPAYSVQVNVDANEKVASTPVEEILQINETYTVEKAFDMDIQTIGRYPLIVTVDYTDLNQYPFSAISSSYFFYKEDVVPKIYGKIDNLGISKSGKLVLTLKNLLDAEIKTRIKLFAPKELSVLEPIMEVDLDSKSEKEIQFDINNFSALVGSSYQIFAVIGYEDNNKRYTISVPGIVKIMERKDFLRTYKWLFIGVGAIIIVVFVVLQFWVVKKTTSHGRAFHKTSNDS